MTDIVANLKANFPAILIFGGAGLGAGLLLKKGGNATKTYGLIGAGIGAAVAAFGVRVPGVTRVGFDLFAHGVPAGGDCRPGWCPDTTHPQHRDFHPGARGREVGRGREIGRGRDVGRGGGRHFVSPEERQQLDQQLGVGPFADQGGGGNFMPHEHFPFQHHHHHHEPHWMHHQEW